MFNERLAHFWPLLQDTAIQPHAEQLQQITEAVIQAINQGDLSRWVGAYHDLPNVHQSHNEQNNVSPKNKSDEVQDVAQLEACLKKLHPWRKGPFEISGVMVDAEWRSDFKWQRLLKGMPDLKNKTVLDVGCGNGYYMFRMAEHQPQLLLGIEPGLLQNVQFWAIEKYTNSTAGILPLRIQDMPIGMSCFDVVFSMGILYHRKSPIDHLEHLKSLMSKGGTLVLETLVVDGDALTCLVPSGRYAQMRNVWFLPSVEMLCVWLQKLGFVKISVIDVSLTTVAEQRSTEWMRFHSLAEFLTADQQQTIEGHSPPKRVIISCQKQP